MATAVRKTFPRIRKTMREHFALILTYEQIKKYARRSAVTRTDVLKYDCTDTMVRDYMIEIIVRDVLGDSYSWPSNGHDTEWCNLFYDKFFTTAEAKGIKIEPRVIKNAKAGVYKKIAHDYREAVRFK